MSFRVALIGQFADSLLEQVSSLAAPLDLQLLEPALGMAAAQSALVAPRPDIAVVSTTLADGSGYAMLRALYPSQRPVAVVCVGTRDDEAVAAFELQATDFVLWPSAPERLRDALTRARQQVLQFALLRTADELQRLLSEAGGGAGVDLRSLFAGRLALSSGPGAADGAAGAEAGAAAGGSAGQGGRGADARRRRRSVGGSSTGTLIPSSPWRIAGRGADGQPARGRDATGEGVLDLSQEDGGRSGAEGRPLRVLVREGRRTRFVPLADVDWFEADGNYIKVHASGESYRTRGTISAIETALDPRQFVRIHRRIVVNMDRVREMSPLPGGDGLLVLGDGSTLRLSRTYRSRVR